MIIWNNHEKLEGKHAFLSASGYHWLNWDDDTLIKRFYSQYATEIGTCIHELASDCIKSRMKLHSRDKHLVEYALYKHYIPYDAFDADDILENLIPFVNDSIGFRMSSEVILYYNDYCFGTTDAISVDEKNNILRISDYKNGKSPVSFNQPLIYAALFFLEYKRDPYDFTTELRIYQNHETLKLIPEPGEIKTIMDLIVNKSNQIKLIRERG